MSSHSSVVFSLLFAAALSGASSCGSNDASKAVRVVGDTTFVQVNGDAVWDTAKALVEDLRIADAAGEEFGMPGELAIAPDGSILIHDMLAEQGKR